MSRVIIQCTGNKQDMSIKVRQRKCCECLMVTQSWQDPHQRSSVKVILQVYIVASKKCHENKVQQGLNGWSQTNMQHTRGMDVTTQPYSISAKSVSQPARFGLAWYHRSPFLFFTLSFLHTLTCKSSDITSKPFVNVFLLGNLHCL